MRAKIIFFISFLTLSLTNKIEISLYKSPLAYEKLKKSDAMIDDIDRTHFLADLEIGTPIQSLPLQVEMASDGIYIVNDKFKPKRQPFLSTENSKTFKESEGIEDTYEIPAIDKIEFKEKNFDFKFKSS